MFSNEDKYQNLLAQLHELNRQNLLNDNEKNEELIQKIDYLNSIIEEKKEEKTNNSLLYKILYLLIGISLFNTILCIFIIFNQNPEKETQKEILSETTQQIENIDINSKEIIETSTIEPQEMKEEVKEEIQEPLTEEEKIPDNAISFNQEVIEEPKDESYEEMKPIIKKDTIYSCEDDNYTKIYKIPYTVEIKGKLYEDRFVFILQNDSGTRKCMINKNDM
eukprot:TRINITY_DN71459_c0_g1_i7.p2 TRINITY_DN71459_c0_g1~~TRINITY_DN71459_c0_g1_i7.p2  ORF type:complete len:221 (-),score=28.70 TRINITY_DN71459_c0_g1_i7:755-1417(-)